MIQRNNIVRKTLAANQNLSCFKELEHVKWEATILQHALIVNRPILCVGMDTDIVIVIVIFILIVLNVQQPLRLTCFNNENAIKTLDCSAILNYTIHSFILNKFVISNFILVYW